MLGCSLPEKVKCTALLVLQAQVWWETQATEGEGRKTSTRSPCATVWEVGDMGSCGFAQVPQPVHLPLPTLQSSVAICCVVSDDLVVCSGEEQGGRSLHYLIPRLLSKHVKMGLPWDGTSHKWVLEVPVIPCAARVESPWFEKCLLCCVCIRETGRRQVCWTWDKVSSSGQGAVCFGLCSTPALDKVGICH